MVWGPGAWSGVLFILDHGSNSFFLLQFLVATRVCTPYSILRTVHAQVLFRRTGIDRSALLLLSWTTFAIYPSCVFCNLRITITPENKHRFCSSLTVESLYDLIVSLDYLH